MEILFEVLSPLFEFLAELALQVAVEWLAARGMTALRAPWVERGKTAGSTLAAIGYTLYGAIAGGLSLLVFPRSFIPSHGLRIASLVVTPLVVGGVMALIGARRRRHDKAVARLDRFAYAYAFAFAMAAVRFVLAGHR